MSVLLSDVVSGSAVGLRGRLWQLSAAELRAAAVSASAVSQAMTATWTLAGRSRSCAAEVTAALQAAINTGQDVWVPKMQAEYQARRDAFVSGLNSETKPFLPAFEIIKTLPDVSTAPLAATLAALFGFGYMKGTFTGTHPWQSAFRTTLIGGLAAAAAYGIAKAIG